MAVNKFLGDAAAKGYSQSSDGGGNNLLLPRSRFEFTIFIHHNGKSVPSPLELIHVSEVQLPSSIFRTAVLNQYNRKRVVNTGVDYAPVHINAYDTKNATIEKFLKEYAGYYFKGPMNSDGKTEIEHYSDIITDGFVGGDSAKGLNLVDKKNFITKIVIGRASSAEDINYYILDAPMITGIGGDTLSYSDSNPSQIRIEISYEGYEVTTTNG